MPNNGRPMRRRIAFILLSVATITACSAPTEACTLLVKPILLATLTTLDPVTLKPVHVDSLYSKIDKLADTFHVCGADTIRVSPVRYKFPNRLLRPAGG